MFNNNIDKLKFIVTYLGLGNIRKIRYFLKNLEIQSLTDNLSETNLKVFEGLIYDKTVDLINNGVITIDRYGLEFFTLIRELKLEFIEALLLEKGFFLEKTPLNNLSRTQTFFNLPEALKQSETLALNPDQPLDLSKTGPFGFSIKA